MGYLQLSPQRSQSTLRIIYLSKIIFSQWNWGCPPAKKIYYLCILAASAVKKYSKAKWLRLFLPKLRDKENNHGINFQPANKHGET
jgi:hypothetical protein